MPPGLKKVVLMFVYLLFFGILIYRGHYLDRLSAIFQVQNKPSEDYLTYFNKTDKWSFFYPQDLSIEETKVGLLTKIFLKDKTGNLKIVLERYNTTENKTTACATLTVSKMPLADWLNACGEPRFVTSTAQFVLKGQSIQQLLGQSEKYDHLEGYAFSDHDLLYAIWPIPAKQDIYAAPDLKEEAKFILNSITTDR